jgi:hypothetical protein
MPNETNMSSSQPSDSKPYLSLELEPGANYGAIYRSDITSVDETLRGHIQPPHSIVHILHTDAQHMLAAKERERFWPLRCLVVFDLCGLDSGCYSVYQQEYFATFEHAHELEDIFEAMLRLLHRGFFRDCNHIENVKVFSCS